MTITGTTTQTETYFDTKLTAVDCDGNPAAIEVTASKDEFDGVAITITTGTGSEFADLTLTEVNDMIAALTAARDLLATWQH